MQVLRTPDKCFEGIKDYPYKPVYTEIISSNGTPLRIHHIDEGPRNGPILFCLLYTSPSPRDYAASRMPSSA